MNGSIIAIFVLVLAVIMPAGVLADGCLFLPDLDTHVYSPSQKAVIAWDGSLETMVLSTQIGMESPEDVAWVVPVPSSSKPEVSEGEMDIFYDIASLLTPSHKGGRSFGDMLPAGNIQGEGVEVIEEKKIDIYDIAILKATDASVLVEWLNDNGYITPNGSIPVLQHYADQDNFYFIANKVNLENKYDGLEITPQDAACLKALQDDFIPAFGIYGFPGEHAEMISHYFRNMDQYPELMAACGNASNATVSVLYSLSNGVATPLRIEFRPSQPFYPMKMTSINEGSLTANIYVVSGSYYEDSSGLFGVQSMTQAPSHITERLGLDGTSCLTYLQFHGDTQELTSDSVFVPSYYDSSKDPNYVSPMEIIGQFVFTMFILTMMAWWFFLVPVAGCYIAGWTLRGKSMLIRLAAFACLVVIGLALLGLSGAFYDVESSAIGIAALLVLVAAGYLPAAFLKWREWKKVLLAVVLMLVAVAAFVANALV